MASKELLSISLRVFLMMGSSLFLEPLLTTCDSTTINSGTCDSSESSS